MGNEDICYECRGLGNDYYFDEDGELVSACDDCPFCQNYGADTEGEEDD